MPYSRVTRVVSLPKVISTPGKSMVVTIRPLLESESFSPSAGSPLKASSFIRFAIICTLALASRRLLAGLSGCRDSRSISFSKSSISNRRLSRSKSSQGVPPRMSVVSASERAPIMVALTSRAAWVMPPMMEPRPERTLTAPSQ